MENTSRHDKICGRRDDLAPGLRRAALPIPLSLIIYCELMSRLLICKRHLPVINFMYYVGNAWNMHYSCL
jgi:hypothetical protein